MLITTVEGGIFLDCPVCKCSILVAHEHDGEVQIRRTLPGEPVEEEA